MNRFGNFQKKKVRPTLNFLCKENPQENGQRLRDRPRRKDYGMDTPFSRAVHAVGGSQIAIGMPRRPAHAVCRVRTQLLACHSRATIFFPTLHFFSLCVLFSLHGFALGPRCFFYPEKLLETPSPIHQPSQAYLLVEVDTACCSLPLP